MAFSAGMDSTVLGCLLKKTKVPFDAAHCNFHLRGDESLRDERFAGEQAEKWGVKFLKVDFDTEKYAQQKKLSIEMAARELRYGWFAGQVERGGYAGLVTAHHGDDQVETVLLNLTRGTSLDGLLGMRPRNGTVLRPLLPFSREEIAAYARENGLQWMEDSTNGSLDYTRNLLRGQVIPVLKRINPSLVRSVWENTGYLRGVAGLYRRLVEEKTALMTSRRGQRERISMTALRSLGGDARAALYEILKRYGLESRTGDVMRSMDRGHSGAVFAGGGYRLLRDRDFLIVEPEDLAAPQEGFEIPRDATQVEHPLRLSLRLKEKAEGQTFDGGLSTACFDADRLVFPLTLRRVRPGDSICPIGMGGRSKKISKLFKDCKLSLFDKRDAWLLCSGDGRIAWAVGVRAAEDFRVTDRTRWVLEVRREGSPGGADTARVWVMT